MTETPDQPRPRRLSWPRLVLLVLAFLLLPQIVCLFIFHADALEEGETTVRGIVSSELLPHVGGALIALWAIWRLGWWRPVFREELRVRAWLWVVPITIVAVSVVTIDWGRLGSVSSAMVWTLLAWTVATAVSEELMFRGIALVAMRDRHREFVAALLSSLIFGAVHLLNALVLGGAAIGESVLAFAVGYVLYVCRRVSGGLVVPIVVHAIHDFATFSYEIGPADVHLLGTAGTLLILLEVAFFIGLLAGYRRLALRPTGPPRQDPAELRA